MPREPWASQDERDAWVACRVARAEAQMRQLARLRAPALTVHEMAIGFGAAEVIPDDFGLDDGEEDDDDD